MDPIRLRSYLLRIAQKYATALNLLMEGRIVEGLRELEDLLKMGFIGNEVAIRLMMAHYYIRLRITNMATLHLNAIKKKAGKNYLFSYMFAKIAEINGDAKGVRKHFQVAIKLNPNERHLHFEYSVALYNLGLKVEAFEKLESRINVASVSFDEYNLLATLYIYDGRVEEAINVLEKAQSIVRTKGFSWKLGQLYLVTGKIEESIKNIEIALAKDSANPYILTALAVCYNIKGDREKTLHYLDDAYKMARSYPDLLRDIALTYLGFDIQKTFNIFQDQLEQVGMDADAYYFVGRVYEELKMVEEAYQMYSKALEFKKTHKGSLAKMEVRENLTQRIIKELGTKSLKLAKEEVVQKTIQEIKQLYEETDTAEEIKSQASLEDFEELFNKPRKLSKIESPEALEDKQSQSLLEKITPKEIITEK